MEIHEAHGRASSHSTGMVPEMILLTRLSGTAFVLNADLIERLDSTPDTVITLVDDKKYVVTETMDEIVSRVSAWRSRIIAGSTHPEEARPPAGRSHLSAVSVEPTSTPEGVR
jgi:flagellar protein FlbD